ncbi:probable DNA polymerase [Anneissia japonica]|uniref:probable DNA polymerase n=1 Tax=Anneissia japonica TaxID=1529436 RepID=UPI001425AF62|nr:probable DNA polymerase [Anneissia japonica]
MGCLFHGCPKCFRPEAENPFTKEPMIESFIKTNKKSSFLKQQFPDFEYVEMWEHDWVKIKAALTPEEKCQLFNVPYIRPILNPRDAFFGGRTNATCLYYQVKQDEEIHYVDFTSLYPYVNKYGTYPIGHPEIIANKNMSTDINDYFGIIKCTIEVPKQLLHPVLPYRTNGKLTFPLCKTCVEAQQQTACNHTKTERSFTGTWVTTEVSKAVEVGYTIERVHIAWHFTEKSVYTPDTPSSGLFTEYINTFLKLKQEASGWPEWCKTPEDQEKYINDYKSVEGITLEKNNIKYNPCLRSLAKLMLNSFWGKFGQKENLTKTKYTQEPNDVYDILTDPQVIVHDINFINDNLAEIKYENEEQFVDVNRKVNVAIAAFTTASARLKLYDLLEKLQERVLYYDTDSVVYVTKPGEWNPPLGDYLGQLTSEIDPKEGKYISCFVSGGPKNYAYKLDSGKTVCKVKGLTLNFANSKKINFETVSNIVKGIGPDIIKTFESNRITRKPKTRKIVNETSTKDYRIVYDKRIIIDNFKTLPYGYVW